MIRLENILFWFTLLSWAFVFPWLAYRNHVLLAQRARFIFLYHSSQQKLYDLSEKNKSLLTALQDVVESKAVQEAPFYGYSEAIQNAKDLLKSSRG